ncbi:MAG: MIP/aquaporin family protein [Chloroflexota bacterium]
MNWKKLAAELIGTFGFLWIGYMSVAAFNQEGVVAPGLLVVPFAFGLGLLAAIHCFGHISGGHFNPAVTIAMILDKRIAVPEAVGYIVAQAIGAIGAGLLVMATISQQAVADGITRPGAGITDVSAVIMEAVGTMGFLLVILTVTKKAASLAGLVIPLALVALHFAMATITGASVNPARSLGSALVGGDIAHLWIYIVGPVIGAVVAFVVWKVMNPGEADA